MTSRPRNIVSPETYLALERAADFKSDYINGEIYAMAGASPEHNLIAANMIAAIRPQLPNRGCRIYGSDQRVKVPNTLLYTYPDILIVCGSSRYDDTRNDTITNPTILIEVLSPTTEAYDRGEKFAHYRRSDMLREYVLVSQDKARVEHFTRQEDDSWVLREYEGEEAEVVFSAVEARLALKDIYEEVFDNE